MNLKNLFVGAVFGISASLLTGVTAALAVSAPPPGSEQFNMLEPHKDFINNMRRMNGGGSCCNLSDGRGNFEEIVETRYDAAGNAYNHYKVVVDPVAFGLTGEKITLDIPRDAILSSEHASQVCESVIARDPLTHTCTRPQFNVIWAVPSSSGNTGQGWHVYCYIPRAQFGNLEQDNQQQVGPATQLASLAP